MLERTDDIQILKLFEITTTYYKVLLQKSRYSFHCKKSKGLLESFIQKKIYLQNRMYQGCCQAREQMEVPCSTDCPNLYF